jgi:hypothetical protein
LCSGEDLLPITHALNRPAAIASRLKLAWAGNKLGHMPPLREEHPSASLSLSERASEVARSWLGQVKRHPGILLAFVLIASAQAVIELWMGRLPLGPDGRFGLWEGDIWSSENSQRVADAYSFSHIGHGILFFGLLWLVAHNLPVRFRFLIALMIETSWEILENSPIIISRYREATIALGYAGDSILNSVSDLIMMSLGFFFASRVRPWVSAALFVAMEVGCLMWVRDNLTLNVIMLIHPFEAIKQWQMTAQPPI